MTIYLEQRPHDGWVGDTAVVIKYKPKDELFVRKFADELQRIMEEYYHEPIYLDATSFREGE